MFGGGLNPARFTALLDEFRQKITLERISARLSQVNQEELVALVKLQAEMKARYLVAVLDLVDPKGADVEGKISAARYYRELMEEVEKGVRSIVDGIVAKEIPMPGLKHEPEFSSDIERAIEEFIARNVED